MDQSDAQLLADAGSGETEAFAEFFRRHVRAVTGFAIRRCENPDQVADAVADTFLVAMQAASRYRPDTESALPWLFGITRRVIWQQRRSIRRQHRLGARLQGFEPRYTDLEEAAINAAIDAARQAPLILAGLRRLAPGERQALELVAYRGLTPTEAATVLGVTPNAVRLRLSRARKKMMSAMRADPAFQAAEVPYG